MTTDTGDESGHEWVRTIVTDGMWCCRCGLAYARWQGLPCGGAAALERRLLRAGAIEAFRAVGELDPPVAVGEQPTTKPGGAVPAKPVADQSDGLQS